MSHKTEDIAKEISILMPVIARKILLEFFESIDIPQTQVLTLMNLYGIGACRLSDLAQFMEVSAPTITGLIDRLENSGYVKRIPDTEDRRAINVKLTKKGEALARRFRRMVSGRWADILQKIPLEDQEHFLRIMRDIKQTIS